MKFVTEQNFVQIGGFPPILVQFDLIRLADTLLDFTVKKEEREAGGGEEGSSLHILCRLSSSLLHTVHTVHTHCFH